MTKYHLSPTTGLPNICRAAKRACPIGGAESHFESKEDARKAFEQQMAAVGTTSVSTRSPDRKQADEKLFKAEEKLAALRKKKVKYQLAGPTGTYAEFHEGLASLNQKIEEQESLVNEALEERDEILQSEARSKSPTPAAPAPPPPPQPVVTPPMRSLKERAPDVYHNDKERISEVFTSGGGVGKPAAQYHAAHHGRFNPATFEGDGGDYYTPGEDSLLIVGQRDGGRARVMVHRGADKFLHPEKELGTPVVHYKSETSNAITWNLHVLGYVSQKGERFGWIPSKRVHFFVF